jgi:putative integral membrane protein (TIGR02587 family)
VTQVVDRRSHPAASLREYGRGFAGGLLFSLPLLYTMEVWWASFIASPSRLLALLAFTFVLLLGYNRHAGLHEDASWIEVAIDSVEELGLGIVTSAVVLFLLGQLRQPASGEEVLAKIVVEAAIVAIGFSVGSAQLGGDAESRSKDADRTPGLASHAVIGVCGAVLFAANVAPTEEIQMIAFEAGPLRLLGVVILSLMTAGAVLYGMGFRRSERFAAAGGKLDVVMGIALTYAIALGVSAILLWFFGRFDGVSVEICAQQIVVLGFPAALGSAAGRLLLQS